MVRFVNTLYRCRRLGWSLLAVLGHGELVACAELSVKRHEKKMEEAEGLEPSSHCYDWQFSKLLRLPFRHASLVGTPGETRTLCPSSLEPDALTRSSGVEQVEEMERIELSCALTDPW